MCVTVGCVFASLVVLLRSDGQAIDEWSLSPATWLAIITAVSNSAIALAHMEAVPISWWYSATHGRSIRALERQWQVTRSAVQVFKPDLMSLVRLKADLSYGPRHIYVLLAC